MVDYNIWVINFGVHWYPNCEREWMEFVGGLQSYTPNLLQVHQNVIIEGLRCAVIRYIYFPLVHWCCHLFLDW